LFKAYQSDSLVKSRKLFRLDGNIEQLIPIESRGFGYDKARCVISLAFPER
jgi:hypothetical protein